MRAVPLREYDLDEVEVAKSEIMVPYASMTNTVPTLYWLLAFVFSSPDLVSALRAELEEAGVATRDGQKITLDLSRVSESRTPRLLACYYETLRVTNHQTSVRRVMHDTTLTDPSTGRTFLLKAGVDVHLCIGTAHLDPSVWGESAGIFDPQRFLDHRGHVTANFKTRQGKAFQPFGGGTHLCPGKNFAFMEIMATMSTLLVGHEVSLTKAGGGAAAKAGVTLPGYAQWTMVDSIHKPVKEGEGLGIRMERRPGFERVEWEYKM